MYLAYFRTERFAIIRFNNSARICTFKNDIKMSKINHCNAGMCVHRYIQMKQKQEKMIQS
jgi:hypothetical protein